MIVLVFISLIIHSFLSLYYLLWSLVLVVFVFGGLYLRGLYFDGLFFLDDFSVCMVFLCLFLFYFVFLIEPHGLKSKKLMWSIMVFMVGRFMVSDFVFFYIIFEVVFILMFIYLMEFGGSPFRFQASFYIFFYTLVFSLPFLIYLILVLHTLSRSLFFRFFFPTFSGFLGGGGFFSFFVFLVFIVKLPIYGVHLWLPKAHVEAPIVGSMLLAGVFLKLGGYGLYRFIFLINSPYGFSSSFFFNFSFYLCVIGGLVVSLICLRQRDLKMLIAYSSVVHMRVMLLGLIRIRVLGVYGAVLVIVAHGFVSPLMFSLMTRVYSEFRSRSMVLLKGVNMIRLTFVFYWFLSCFINLGIPPFMSFFGEVYIFRLIGCFLINSWVLMIFLIFFTGVYCVYSYSRLVHGERSFFSFLRPHMKILLV